MSDIEFKYINLKSLLRPRISIFAGDLLFINGTYTFDLPKNLSNYQIGSTFVLPIPLNLNLNWNNSI